MMTLEQAHRQGGDPVAAAERLRPAQEGSPSLVTARDAMLHGVNGPSNRRADSERDAPKRWLGSTALIDLQDPRLAIRAKSLTQFAASNRAKAVALHDFVMRLPYCRPFKMRHRCARAVLDAGGGDGPDKAMLLLCLLRQVGVPSRLRMVRLDGGVMKGLVNGLRSISWPFVEIWLDGRWLLTDTYIFDPKYVAAARKELVDSGQRFGFGIYAHDPPTWTGLEHATLSSLTPQSDPMVLEDMGPFHDHSDYMNSAGFRSRHSRVLRFLRWNLCVPAMRLAAERLRG